MEIKYCECCGLYLGVVRPTRKYCSECKRKVNRERDRKRKKAAQEKKKPEKTFPSIGEVQALADKLGKHYGEVSQMLATGKLTYER
jgi:hypothetical protein